MTQDGLPFMGGLPNEPETYFCVRFSGRGDTVCLGAAERTVDVTLDGSSAGALDVGRFD